VQRLAEVGRERDGDPHDREGAGAERGRERRAARQDVVGRMDGLAAHDPLLEVDEDEGGGKFERFDWHTGRLYSLAVDLGDTLSAVTDDDIARTATDLRLVLGRLVRRARRESSVLPLSQMAVLGHFDRGGPMTTSELAAAERVRPQSMARTVALLGGAGLVDARPHPEDGRKTLLAISTTGLATLTAQRERREGWLAEAIERELTPAERRTLTRSIALLERLTEH
jgi:DNA-binding MarR family transcriptional regulator